MTQSYLEAGVGNSSDEILLVCLFGDFLGYSPSTGQTQTTRSNRGEEGGNWG